MTINRVRFGIYKLVRDKIPLLMKESNILIRQRQLDTESYIKELKNKLVEEAQEAACAEPGQLHDELCDVLEVLLAIAAATGSSFDQINSLRKEKHKVRGGFDNRIFTEYVEAPPSSEAFVYFSKDPVRYPVITEKE